jgi:outer membrane protein TolC
MKRTAAMIAALLPLAAQALTLQEALERSDQSSYAGRLANGRLQERSGQELSSLQGLMPAVRAEGGWSATDDPLNAFGTRLRQRSITMESFDPAALNDPSRASGWNAALVAEVPLVNVDAWKGRTAASGAVEAARRRQEAERIRARNETAHAYFDAVLAQAAVRTWQDALNAAQAHRSQAASGSREGTVLRSDLLLSQVRLGEIEASLAKAQSDSALALRRLAFAMGSPESAPTSLEGFPETATLQSAAAALPESGKRPEEEAGHAEAKAAALDAERVGATLLPRLNGIARMDWNASGVPFSKDPSWTVGVQASWSLHATGEVGDRQAARARAEEARVMEAMTKNRLDLEEASLESGLKVALQRLSIAETAVSQAEEAHRLTARRYQEGLATMAETLQAAALETSTRLSLESARHDVVVGLSDLSALRGLDSRRLETLTKTASTR